jgi:glycosyltransferase involved in cell wall biosynthesis
MLLTSPAALNRVPFPEKVMTKIHWVCQGIDTDLFTPAPDRDSPERLEEEQRHPSILFLASISHRKGIFTLVRAMPLVLAALPNARLSVAGTGPELDKVAALVEELNLTGHLDFLGRQENSAAPDLYRRHAVFCLPSLGEPFATTVREAMSCGRPLVITNSGGLPYMAPGECSLRVPNDDPPALAAALIQLLKDPQRRAAMGAANRNFALQTYAWPRIIAQMEEIYYGLLPVETRR